MARTRDQSVLEVLEEKDFFIRSCPSERDDVNSMRRFGMNDRYRDTSQEAECHEPLLVVGEAVILKVTVGPSNTREASTKSKPCCLRLDFRFRSSQVKRIHRLYIQH
jgi:hypothetical protein